jgi:hypothetical protein
MRARSHVAVVYSYTVGYHMMAIPRFSPLHSAIGTTCAGCRVRLAVRSLEECHLYSRTNFKLDRAAALAEWRQLLSA